MATARALTERAFSERRKPTWEELETLCMKTNVRGLGAFARESGDEVARLPLLYRDVCADLAAAEAARYSAPLVEYLRGLTASGHTVLYGARAGRDHERAQEGAARGLTLGKAFVLFPREVRRRWRSMSLASALFFLPMILGLLLTLRDPTYAYRLVPESMLRPLTEAYARGFDGGRASGEGTLMAGYYVYNNVGIALRCFAMGLFGGLGSAFYLVQNGLSIGAMFGYVTANGAGVNIGTFIVGHGSLELGAIVLSGGAGLSLGWSIVAPGELTRTASLQKTARELLVVVAGAAVMLLAAAAIEAFFSGSSLPRAAKLSVGATLFVAVVVYIALGGRRRRKAALHGDGRSASP